jgi:mannan endo-1,4-beta-mannosidase
MRTTTLLALMAIASTVHAVAQTPIAVDVTVDTRRDTFAISPYIFGSNAQSDDRDEHVAAIRLGGNRLTGYNWENNASNAGSDYFHQSDTYLTRDLPASVENVPAIVLTSFHDSARALGAYSLVTLPAAGYVARDKNGPVSEAETAPSARWDEVVPKKGGPLVATPDLDDGQVYVDEEVSYLVGRLGAASSGGIRGYAIDNEPALWPTTHPRIHPAKTTIAEVIDRSIAVARAVKSVDPDADVYGAVSYGFGEYYNMQDAPDWSSYASYGSFLDAFLAKMREAHEREGRRLVDVLDLHWYPEARGTDDAGHSVRIAFDENSDPGVAEARMQAPRSLWDSTYRETSWIAEYFSPIALLPNLRATIQRRYPGTKLAFTEINYGGSHDVSGGLAMVDVLGIFADYGVYMSNYWGAIEDYTSAAYRLYRNVDGEGGSFGTVHVASSTSDRESTSVHASLDGSTLHIVMINKNRTTPVDASVAIASDRTYAAARVVGFDRSGSSIRALADGLDVADGRLSYTIPPLTAVHIIIPEAPAAAVTSESSARGLTAAIRSSTASSQAMLAYSIDATSRLDVEIVDLLGRVRRTLDLGPQSPGEHRAAIPTDGLEPGAYAAIVTSDRGVVAARFLVE